MWKESLYRISPMKAARDAVACFSTSFRNFLMSLCMDFFVSLPSLCIVSADLNVDGTGGPRLG